MAHRIQFVEVIVDTVVYLFKPKMKNRVRINFNLFYMTEGRRCLQDVKTKKYLLIVVSRRISIYFF